MTKYKVSALLVLFLLSAFLRFQGISCGLPSKTERLSTFHFDEYMTFDALSKMEPEKMNFYPGVVMCWGSFQIYMQGATLKLMQYAGFFSPKSKEDFKQNFQMADRMYLSGRILTALFSLASVIVFFAIAGRFMDFSSSLIAAGFFAFSYVEVYMASLVKPDSIMLFFALCSLYFLLFWIKSEKITFLALSAFFQGLSFASKYTGIIFSFCFIAYSLYLLFTKRNFKMTLKNSAVYFSICFFVFFAVNFYFLILPKESFGYFSAMFAKTKITGDILGGYKEYFFEILPVSFGAPFSAISVFALFYVFIKKEKPLYIPALFAIFYLIKFGYPLRQAFTYSLALLPFFSLLAGFLFFKSKGKNLPVKIFLILTLVYSFSYSYYQKSSRIDENTIKKSSDWIKKEISENKNICVSRIEVWTPMVLRKYAPNHKMTVFGKPETKFEQGLSLMLEKANSCDYFVLSEYEKDIINSDDTLKNLFEKSVSHFSLKASFLRDKNRFFEISNSHHYVFASLANPDIFVYEKRKGTKGRGNASHGDNSDL